MSRFWSTLLLGYAMVLTACGGGSNPGADSDSGTAPIGTASGGNSSSSGATSTGAASSSSSSSSATAPTGPAYLAPGTSYTMPADTTVYVPSGTTVNAPNGTVITINGSADTIVTQVGSVVSVPASATGAANDAVTTGSNANGTAATSGITVTVLAGSATTNLNPTDGTGTAAIFWGGGRLAYQNGGNLMVSDRGALRVVTPAGVVTTIADATPYDWQGIALDTSGNVYGSGQGVGSSTTAPFDASIEERTEAGSLQGLFVDWEASASPSEGFGGLARDAVGNLYLADAASNRIIKFSEGGGWSVFAGSGTSGAVDGTGSAAQLTLLTTGDLPIDGGGNLYINTGSAIRKITPDGVVTTLFSGLTSATGALALDEGGNFYFVNFDNIVRIDSKGNETSFPFPNTTDFVTSMTTDSSGNLYIGTRGVGTQIFKIAF